MHILKINKYLFVNANFPKKKKPFVNKFTKFFKRIHNSWCSKLLIVNKKTRPMRDINKNI